MGALEWRMPRQHLVGYHPERVQITAGVDLLPGRLFRTHVHGSPYGHSLPRSGATDVGCCHSPRDAEVGEERPAGGLIQKNVFRLYIPVDHARSTGCVQRAGEVGNDPGGFSRIQSPLSGEPLAQALAGDLIHDIVKQAVGATGRVDPYDVRVAQTRNGARLGQKTSGDGLVRSELGMHDLDRYPAVERDVGRQEDHSHTAATQLALETVLRSERCLERSEEIEGGIAHVVTDMREIRIYTPFLRALNPT
jgi:hypothetical protein